MRRTTGITRFIASDTSGFLYDGDCADFFEQPYSVHYEMEAFHKRNSEDFAQRDLSLDDQREITFAILLAVDQQISAFFNGN